MKVKSKVRVGAAALLLLCAFLSLCSRSCISNLVSALEAGGEGQPELLVEPPRGAYKPIPVPVLVPSSPQGAANQAALPDCQSAPPLERELALNLTTFSRATYMGGRQPLVVPTQLSSSSSSLFFLTDIFVTTYIYFFKKSFF